MRYAKRRTIYGGSIEDMRDIYREIDAIMLGESIDRVFQSECWRLGLDHDVALTAPMAFIALALCTANFNVVH